MSGSLFEKDGRAPKLLAEAVVNGVFQDLPRVQ